MINHPNMGWFHNHGGFPHTWMVYKKRHVARVTCWTRSIRRCALTWSPPRYSPCPATPGRRAAALCLGENTTGTCGKAWEIAIECGKKHGEMVVKCWKKLDFLAFQNRMLPIQPTFHKLSVEVGHHYCMLYDWDEESVKPLLRWPKLVS